MAYFPNAYKKVFLGRGFQLNTPYIEYAGGDFGFFDPRTWTPINVAGATMAAHPKVVLVLGNPDHTTDKIGPHGGYQESIKSQVIDPRYVDRFWKVYPRPAVSHIVQIGWDGINDETAPIFTCGKTYWLRIDVKGSPALRTLGHNLYHVFSISTGCCANIGNPERVDPVAVMIAFAKQISADPVFSSMVLAQATALYNDEMVIINPDTYVTLTDPIAIANTAAGLSLAANYTDTQFANCSFDPLDHYETEPLLITSAQFVNEEGATCSDFQQLAFKEIQAPKIAQGTGDQVLRDYLLSQSYRHDFYPRDVRLREAAADMHLVAGHVIRTPNFGYINYYILHRVPRRSNPTGVYNQDQYLIQLSVPEDTTIDYFEAWMQNYLTSAGTGVIMEDLSGEVVI